MSTVKLQETITRPFSCEHKAEMRNLEPEGTAGVMLITWAERRFSARAMIASVVAGLLLLQSIALALSSSGELDRRLNGLLRDGALIANALCSADGHNEGPAQSHHKQSNCCVLCETSRGPDKAHHFVILPAREPALFGPRSSSAVVYSVLGRPRGGPAGRIRSWSARAPPHVS
jgi:hypothetical protein